MRGKITKRSVDALHVGVVLWDTELRGFAARRLASGRISYGLKYTDSSTGRQRWLSLGLHGALTPEQARKKAAIERGRVAAGIDPQNEKQAARIRRSGIVTVSELLDVHIKLYVEPQQLRSQREIARAYDKYIRPAIGRVPLSNLRRSHVVGLLDDVALKHGPVMADRVLAYLRKPLNWHAARDDEFVVPIVRGMTRTKPRERARERILSDEEIGALWLATEPSGSDNYRLLIRVLLLTAQRRQEVAGMRRSEVERDTWTIPGERAKNGRENVVPLPPTAIALIGIAPRWGDFVFGGSGIAPFSGFSKSKCMLDDRMREALAEIAPSRTWKPWVVRDLRRTARSLMSRAGVRPEIAERVLNHVISGVQGVYDRHNYVKEKKAALLALEALVLRIVGAETNVIDLAAHRVEIGVQTSQKWDVVDPCPTVELQ